MKTINAKNQKTFEALQSKANGKGRFPSVKRIAALLSEISVEFRLIEVTTSKQRESASNAFATSTGKTIHGWKIQMQSPTGGIMEIDNTCSHFSKNTETFADDILRIIRRLK